MAYALACNLPPGAFWGETANFCEWCRGGTLSYIEEIWDPDDFSGNVGEEQVAAVSTANIGEGCGQHQHQNQQATTSHQCIYSEEPEQE